MVPALLEQQVLLADEPSFQSLYLFLSLGQRGWEIDVFQCVLLSGIMAWGASPPFSNYCSSLRLKQFGLE